MKKWYVITGILALLLVISMSTCSINSGAADRAEQELDQLKETSEQELAQLKATKEISFGNGLKVFDIEKTFYEVQGKVQNVSSEPMQKIVVVVAFYNKDGQLDEDWGSVGTCSLQDLFPSEVIEWKIHFGNWTDQDVGLFDVYAIGNKR